jgi:hypothetical protein
MECLEGKEILCRFFFHASACDLACLASASEVCRRTGKSTPASIAALREKIDVCRSHFILINDNEDDEIGFASEFCRPR